MSEVSANSIRKCIKEILVGADLTQLTSKKVRKQLELKFNEDFTARKKEIDDILMHEIKAATASQSDGNDSGSASEEESDNESSNDSESSYEKKSKPKAKSPAPRKRRASPDRNSKAKSKKSKTPNSDKPRKGTGFSKDMALSEELATLFGTDMLPRCDVVKKMYGIFKERDLMDPSNKQFVICDDQLLKIFGVKRFRAFGMMKYLKKHVKDPKDTI